MAAKLAEAQLVLTLDDKLMKEALAKLPGQAERAADSIKSIGRAVDFSVFVKFGEIAKSAMDTIGNAVGELVSRGGEVRGIEGAFSSLTASIGETKDEMLATSRDASKGLISDFDLMAAGNKALLLGLPVTSASFGTMAKAATTLGRAMGEDTKKSFDDLITALGRSSPMILDNLGLTVNVSKANEAYAKVLGKSADALTDAEKKTAFYNAAMAAAEKKSATIGDAQLTLAESLKIARNSMQNFGDSFSAALVGSNSLMTGVKEVGKALSTSFGFSQQSLVGGFVGLIEGLAIALVNCGQGAIFVGHIFASTFHAVEMLVNGALTAVVGFAGGVVGTVDAMARLAAALPFASDGTKRLAAMTSDAKTKLDAMTTSLAKSTVEAAKGVIGQSALHTELNSMSGSLFALASNMENTRGSIASVTDATNNQGKAADEATTKNQDMAAKVAQAFRDLNNEIAAGTKIGLEKRLFEIDAAREKEIARINADKDLTKANQAEMIRLTNELYAQKTAAAILSGDEVLAKETEVQQAIAMQYMSGTAAKVAQIEIARDKEIAALAYLKANNEQRYAEDVAAVSEKYRLQIDAANGYYASIEAAMAANGFKTRSELQAELVAAQAYLTNLQASHESTANAIAAAKKKVHDLQIQMDGEETLSAQKKFEIIMSAASTMLKSLFGKNKAAAIAAAIIDTAAAAVAAFKNAGGLPFGAFAAAATVAAGYAQIQTIRNTNPDGFAQGTPGLDFADFGPESWHPLHNQEAVIPRGGGHMLAGEIADSMPGQEEQLSLLRRLVAAAEAAPAETRKAMRNAMILDMA